MPTIITKTIDAGGGGDYTTFTAAEAAVVTLVTTDDMVANDEAIVFECVAGTYNETVTFDSSSPGPALTMDATRNITYRAAAGSGHGGDPTAGPRLKNANSVAHTAVDAYTTFEGLVFEQYDPVLDSGYGLILRGVGVSLLGCILNYPSQNRDAAQIEGGSAAQPILFENSVINCSATFASRRAVGFQLTSGTQYARLNNCTINAGGSQPFGVNPGAGSTTCYLEINNCNLIGTGGYRTQNGGVLNFTGADNTCASGTQSALPLAQQALSQAWTFSTDPLAASTGSQVIYDAATGALINAPGNDAIGVCGVTGTPTTDINGEDRIRDTHADPGAFVAPLRTITKSIDGAGGGDYTTFTAAEAAVGTLPTDADMVQRNEAVVFECVAGTYDGLVFSWTLTTDAARNVTFTPATGSEHGGVFGAGVILQDNTAVTSTIALMNGASTNNCVFDGIAFNVRSGVSSTCTSVRSGVGHIWRNCLFSSEGTGTLNGSPDGFSSGSASAPIVYENCVTKGSAAYLFNSNKTGSSMRFVNCTHMTSERMFDFFTYAASSQAAEIVNCANLGGGSNLQDAGATATAITGSGNVGGATHPFPVGLQASSQTWTFSTDPLAASTGSQVIYDATNGAMLNVPGNDAVGVCGVTGIPTTDINGEDRIRDTHADPGAFVAPLRTIAKSIDGAGGGDYTTFVAAEAAVASLVTDADMVQRNEAIVFEAVAGTYNESVTLNSSTPGPALTMDATRNITYRAAAGSEHGGQFESGANITGYCLVQESFAVVDGLSISNGVTAAAGSDGTIVRNSMLYSPTGTAITLSRGGTAIDPVTVENCVAKADATRPVDIRSEGAGVDSHWRVVNCTAFVGTGWFAFNLGLSSSDNLYLELVNNLAIGDRSYIDFGNATVFLTGSDNVGGATSPFPVAQQASSQTWTFSTNPADPSTGSQVIYDATNGAMVNVPGNDAVGVGTSTGAPTTDILGADRIREGSYGAFYADPGAFTTDRVDLGGTVGVGKDYATYTAAEAATGGYANLPKSNVRYVFTATPGETISESNILGIYNAGETGPHHNVRFQCLDKTDRARRLQPTTSDALRIQEGFVEWDGIDIEAVNRSVLFQTVSGVDTVGTRFSNCVLDTSGVAMELNKAQLAENQGSAAHPQTFENVLATGTRLLSSFVATAAHTGGAYFVFRNCTRLSDTTSNTFLTMPSATTTGMSFSTIEVYNCLNLAPGTELDAEDYLGSGNVGCGGAANSNSFTSRGVGVNYTRTTDPLAASTGSQVIYDATNGAMLNVPGNDAVGVGTSTGAPATDILGKDRLRGAYADPGAFTTDLVTTTRTIDAAGGGDYTTFTAAEAAVSTLPAAADMVQRNEAIVFDAVAGTYNETVTFDSSSPGSVLTMDATRNITYRAASGRPVLEHTGAGSALTFDDPYTLWSGIDVLASSSGEAVQVRAKVGYGADQAGLVIENVTITAATVAVACNKLATSQALGTSAAPITLRNIVTKARVAVSQFISGTGHTAGAHCLVVNCTHLGGSSPNQVWNWALTGGMPDASFKIINCANLAQDTSNDANITSGGVDISGSQGNVGNAAGSTSSFHFANIGGGIGAQYTPTTNTSPGAGDWAIFDSTTGALQDVPDNDIWKILTDLSVAPATDIEGVTREATGYNPGAFERTAADVGTPPDGGVDYLRDLNIRDRFLRGAAIREPFLRNLRG